MEHQKQQGKNMSLRAFILHYFKTKYGLNRLIEEHTEELLEGTRLFRNEDASIYLFDKMMRNRVD